MKKVCICKRDGLVKLYNDSDIQYWSQKYKRFYPKVVKNANNNIHRKYIKNLYKLDYYERMIYTVKDEIYKTEQRNHNYNEHWKKYIGALENSISTMWGQVRKYKNVVDKILKEYPEFSY